jgi:F0F1-type ATP synthase epsilon subunit
MNTFSLKVIASDKVFFDGKCGIIIVPALDGEQAIMSHHEDMVIATREGEVRSFKALSCNFKEANPQIPGAEPCGRIQLIV